MPEKIACELSGIMEVIAVVPPSGAPGDGRDILLVVAGGRRMTAGVEIGIPDPSLRTMLFFFVKI